MRYARARAKERRENDPNYSDGRVRHKVVINGVTKSRHEWCRQYDIQEWTVASRLRMGWHIVRAITTPKNVSPGKWGRTTKRKKTETRERHREIGDALFVFYNLPCAICGKYWPKGAMHADHIDPSQKKFQISKCMSRSVADVRAELSKCRPVCSNCHRAITFADRKRNEVPSGLSWVMALKDRACADCGDKYPREAMDFDHRPGEKKGFEIGNLVGAMACNQTRVTHECIVKFLREINKCDIVCSCCHAIRGRDRALEGQGVGHGWSC